MAVEKAIKLKTRLEIEYNNSYGQYSVRTIIPKVLYEKNGQVYIDAFCKLRGEKRTFRLDRISEIRGIEKCYLPALFLHDMIFAFQA